MRRMRLTLLLPGALLPAELAGELGRLLDAPVLARWLQRATPILDRSVSGASGDAAWIAASVFGMDDAAAAPTAPFAWAALTGDASGSATIWHADPIHVAIGRDSLIVHPLDVAPGDVESDALLATANACLAGSRAELRRSGAHWFLHSAQPWSLCAPPLDAVIDAPYSLPDTTAADAARWSRLHNAIQMSWHEHPVNRQREDRGADPINALWLHGGGRWAPLPAMRWTQVFSDRPVLRGAALAAGASAHATAEPWAGGALIDLPQALPAARSGDWTSWPAALTVLDRELGRVPAAHPIELVLTARDRVRSWLVNPADRLRFWRRNELVDALSTFTAPERP